VFIGTVKKDKLGGFLAEISRTCCKTFDTASKYEKINVVILS